MAIGNTIVINLLRTPVSGGLLLAGFTAAEAPAGVFSVVSCSRGNVKQVGDELVASRQSVVSVLPVPQLAGVNCSANGLLLKGLC
jgi:acyl-CoA reductase-like NAD-dependent aldehyde dehydrogenase